MVKITVLSLALCANMAAANLIVNPGFETGDFTGWTVGGNSVNTGVAIDATAIAGEEAPFIPAFVNVRSGTYAGFAVVECGSVVCGPAEFISLSQTIAVLPNTDYSIGFYLGNDSPSNFGIVGADDKLQIFVNGVGLLAFPNTGFGELPGNTPANFHLFSDSFNSGLNNSVTVTFRITASGTSRAGASFDDFFVDGPAGVIPEPTTSLLIGCGLALAVLARRRLS